MLPVDIIPLSHPYQITEKDPITFQIFFNKQPLRHSLVKVWHRLNNKTTLQNLGTDVNGKLSFPITNKGTWIVSTVKMIHLENDSKANWQSYWGSCTWGYE